MLLNLGILPLFTPLALAASGTLSFLTFNVAGLPAFINDNGVPGDKKTNTATIGEKFAQYGYDIIHVQEDFNYHSTLYENDNHTHRTPTSGGVPFGSGLNTLANYDWTRFDRVTWSKCFINEGDCLTPKGFTYMRMVVTSGIEIDLYNVHADAGSDKGDGEARTSNMKQVADYIDAHSAGRAVIVGGDTNCRYTRLGDGIRVLSSQNGLTDVWIEKVRGGSVPAENTTAVVCQNPSTTLECEIVDKVFYRSGQGVNLAPIDFQYAGHLFLQPNGSVLSDHNPILVNFNWMRI